MKWDESNFRTPTAQAMAPATAQAPASVVAEVVPVPVATPTPALVPVQPVVQPSQPLTSDDIQRAIQQAVSQVVAQAIAPIAQLPHTTPVQSSSQTMSMMELLTSPLESHNSSNAQVCNDSTQFQNVTTRSDSIQRSSDPDLNQDIDYSADTQADLVDMDIDVFEAAHRETESHVEGHADETIVDNEETMVEDRAEDHVDNEETMVEDRAEDHVDNEEVIVEDRVENEATINMDVDTTSQAGSDIATGEIGAMKFGQVGGDSPPAFIFPGWGRCLEDEDVPLPSDLIRFLCYRIVQLIPYKRLRLMDIDFEGDQLVIEGWLGSPPPVACVPLDDHGFWILMVIVNCRGITHILTLDGRPNNESAVANGTCDRFKSFIERSGVATSSNEVPIRLNRKSSQSGLEMVDHLIRVVRIVHTAKHPRQIATSIKNISTTYVKTPRIQKSELKTMFEDSLIEKIYDRAYWGHYQVKQTLNWWPCRRFAISYGLLMSTKKRIDPESVPVVWFDMEPGDEIWMNPNELVPLSQMSLEEVIKNGKFSAKDIERLRESYRQACT